MIAGFWWPAYYGWKQLFPTSGRNRFAAVAAAGVALGVAVLLVVMAVMDGFQMDIRRRLISLHGEAAIVGDGTPFPVNGEFVRQLEGLVEIEAALPFYESFALLELNGRYAFPLTLGLDGDAVPDGGILLGPSTVEQLGATIGEEVLLVAPQALLGSNNGEIVLPLQLSVAGALKASRGGADCQRAIVSRAALSELFGDGDSAHGYEMQLGKRVDCEEFVRKLNDGILPKPFKAVSWMDMNGELMAVLAMERAAMFFSMAGIVAVAAFAMGCFLASHVARKSRDVAVLRAMGCGRRDIAASFFLQSVFVGLLGSVFGVITAALMLHFRDGLLALLISAFGRGERLLSFYAFDSLPMCWRWVEVVKICSMAVAVAALAGVVPALRAAAVDPSKTLRHE